MTTLNSRTSLGPSGRLLLPAGRSRRLVTRGASMHQLQVRLLPVLIGGEL